MKPERSLSVARKVCWIGGVLWAAAVPAQAELDGFAPAVNGPVTSVAAQADGKVVIGGVFTEVNGITQPYLARLNADGSVDTSFTPTPGPGQFVNHVAISQSKIFVSGGDGIAGAAPGRLAVSGAGLDPVPDVQRDLRDAGAARLEPAGDHSLVKGAG